MLSAAHFQGGVAQRREGERVARQEREAESNARRVRKHVGAGVVAQDVTCEDNISTSARKPLPTLEAYRGSTLGEIEQAAENDLFWVCCYRHDAPSGAALFT